ncbi:MAG: ABC transporter transmembrane domain-containing protein, partial [Halobacteriaceae archaeon]
MSVSAEEDPDSDLNWSEKLSALIRVAKFRPKFVVLTIILSLFTAFLEGFGLSFVLPIIELAQSSGASTQNADGLLGVFLFVYDSVGIPFTLEYLILGVVGVMTLRFSLSFTVKWFLAILQTKYVRYLQETAFNSAIDARISYFDEEGSDDILNAIVTQAEYAGRVIRYVINIIDRSLRVIVYAALAVYLAPRLMVITAVFLGAITLCIRRGLDAGYSVGDKIADAKERIQEQAQAGTQGIRDVKMFGLADELRSDFQVGIDQFEGSMIKLRRNQAAIQDFYQLITAITIFVLIYVALTFASFSVGVL